VRPNKDSKRAGTSGERDARGKNCTPCGQVRMKIERKRLTNFPATMPAKVERVLQKKKKKKKEKKKFTKGHRGEIGSFDEDAEDWPSKNVILTQSAARKKKQSFTDRGHGRKSR